MIIRCTNRKDHQHGEDLYQRYAEVLQHELLKISENVSINQFDMRLTKVWQFDDVIYRPNFEMQRLAKLCKATKKRNSHYQGFKMIPVGAFEVYFMGLKLHSKIMSMQWPRISALVGIC